jgi:hypothetical protein
LENQTGSVKLEVLNPLSDVTVTGGNAARLDTLNGKTLCEVYTTGDYSGDRTFPVIRELLQRRFPDVKMVPYTEFAIGVPKATPRWGPYDRVGEILREKECDAVLLGNGG